MHLGIVGFISFVGIGSFFRLFGEFRRPRDQFVQLRDEIGRNIRFLRAVQKIVATLQIGDRGHVVRGQRFDVPFFDIVFDLNGILVALHVRTRLGLADIFGPQHGIVSLRVFGVVTVSDASSP